MKKWLDASLAQQAPDSKWSSCATPNQKESAWRLRPCSLLRSKGYCWRGGDLEPEQMTFAPSGVVTTFCVHNNDKET